MTVFADIAAAVTAQLQATPAIAPVRDSMAGTLPQNLAACIGVSLGTSTDIDVGVAYIDWRTEVHVDLEARQAAANVPAAQALDAILGAVLDRLRGSQASLMARLAGCGLLGINSAPGDRRIARDLVAADSQLAAATYTVAIYHRTQADGLTPWA